MSIIGSGLKYTITMTELGRMPGNRPSKIMGKYFHIYQHYLSKKYDSGKETVMIKWNKTLISCQQLL